MLILLDDASKYLNFKNHRFDYREFLREQEEKMRKYKYNVDSLIKLRKSFLIDNFFYATDREMSRGAHRIKSEDRFVPLSGNEFGDDYKYLVNADTGRTTLKYELVASLFNRSKIASIFEEKSKNVRKLSNEEKLELQKIRISHVMPYDKLVSNLFADVQLKNKKVGISIEELNTIYKLDSTNKGYVLYKQMVN